MKTADGTKLPARTTLALVPKDATQAEHAPVNDKDEAEINSVKPGEYYFDLSLANKKYFVTKLLADGKPLPNDRIQITAGANISVTIIAAPGTGTLTGFAKANGKPAPGVMVLMLSTDKLVDGEEFWKDQTDLDGSFILTDIPPGHYNLLAIQDGWDLAWQRNEVLAHYLPLAVPGHHPRHQQRHAQAPRRNPRPTSLNLLRNIRLDRPLDQIIQLIEPPIRDHALHLMRIRNVLQRIPIHDHNVRQLPNLNAPRIQIQFLRRRHRSRAQRLIRSHPRHHIRLHLAM